MSFILGSALGIFLFALVANQSIKWNKARLNRKYSYPLFPNCLITRHPVVFIHGRKSLFYFGNYWNFIPQFLIDHGYEVIDLDLPWRDEAQREKEFMRFLKLMTEKSIGAHFIGDITSKKILDDGQKRYPEIFKSLNVMSLRDVSIPLTENEPLSFRLHRLVTGRQSDLDGRILGLTDICDLKDVGRIYLRKLVELAESDLQHGEPHNEPRIQGFEPEPQLQL